VIHALAVAAIGVYAGAMLTERGVLVPWWRSLPPAEFLGWYPANYARLNRFFGTLTVVALVAALADAAVAGGGPVLGAAAAMVTCVAMLPVYFAAANARFAAGTIAAAEVPAALTRWARWHDLRTALSLVALVEALLR